MFFKNLIIYRMTLPQLNAETLEAALAEKRAKPCGRTELSTYGFVSPFNGGADGMLVHAADGHLMIATQSEEKVLPGSVLRDALMERVKQIELRDSRKVYKKERDQLKDEVLVDMLPRAFVRRSILYAVLSPAQGFVIVNTASPAKAETLISAVRDALGSLPAGHLVVDDFAVRQHMTGWLRNGFPDGFYPQRSCELRDPLEGGGTIRCKGQDLESDEILQHLEAGKQVVKLALDWSEKLSFTMTEYLQFRQVAFGDVVMSELDKLDGADALAERDASLVLMMGTLMEFLPVMLTYTRNDKTTGGAA